MDFNVIIIIYFKFMRTHRVCISRFFRYYDGTDYGHIGGYLIGICYYAVVYGTVYGKSGYVY